VEGTSDTFAGPITFSSESLRIGSGTGTGGAANYFFSGGIDEVRISNIARSADWITTSYRNQNSPGTYLTFNNQETF